MNSLPEQCRILGVIFGILSTQVIGKVARNGDMQLGQTFPLYGVSLLIKKVHDQRRDTERLNDKVAELMAEISAEDWIERDSKGLAPIPLEWQSEWTRGYWAGRKIGFEEYTPSSIFVMRKKRGLTQQQLAAMIKVCLLYTSDAADD